MKKNTVEIQIARIEEKLDSVLESYVTRQEFAPIKAFVYGIIGLTLTGVFISILTLAIK